MATIQERLNRMRQDGESAGSATLAQSVQQRLERMRRDGLAAGVTLPTAGQGTVTLPRADQSGGGGEGVSSAASVPAVQAPPFVPAYAAAHAPTLGARNIEAVQADMDGVDRVIQGLKERQRDLNGQADLYDNRESAWGRLGYVDLDGKDSRQVGGRQTAGPVVRPKGE